MSAPWFADPGREALVERLDRLHDAAWREHDLTKRTMIESEWSQLRSELTRRDRDAEEHPS